MLGYRSPKDGQYSSRAILRGKDSEIAAVWATKKLETILAKCEKFFESKVDKYRRKTFWLTPMGEDGLEALEIVVKPLERFLTNEGKIRVWNDIWVVSAPNLQKLEELRALAQEGEKTDSLCEPKQQLLLAPAPNNKDAKKTLDLLQGEYICIRYSQKLFKNSLRTYLHLLPIGEDGEPTTDIEIATYGYFLEKELVAAGGILALEKRDSPFLCSIGKERTTPQKKKDRLVALAL